METITKDPGEGNYTGTVTVRYTPSKWIESRAIQYKSQLYEFDLFPTAREKAIMDFLDLYLKGEFN